MVTSPDLLAAITLAVKVHYRPYSHGSHFPHSQCILVHVGTAGKRTLLSQSIQHTLRNLLLQLTTFTVNTVDIHIKRGETFLSFPPNNGNHTSKINERLIKISYFICLSSAVMGKVILNDCSLFTGRMRVSLTVG